MAKTCKCECQGLVKIPIERYTELTECERIYKAQLDPERYKHSGHIELHKALRNRKTKGYTELGNTLPGFSKTGKGKEFIETTEDMKV